jgi:regulator of protease activity HflC (stomatin/prohibitin superfamily)
MDQFYAFAALISAIGGIIHTFFKTFQFVQEGERGIKLRFGRALVESNGKPRIIEPGFVLLIPWVDSLQRRHVRQQTLRFDRQNVMLNNGMIFEISAVVIFRVNDVYKAMFEINGVEESIEDLSMGVLRDQMSVLDHEGIVETEDISKKLLSELKVKADEWGIDFIQFKITHCAPTAESASIVNAKAGTKLKVEALLEAIEGRNVNERIDPNLAAVLLGFPLVASTSNTVVQMTEEEEKDEKD